ncbi:VOC family protein [Permianibacter sp. IMCC34836]|uniref:VOC family protein n=1 Tax=Permianibacter fluminis TaxID=2738515 RepID=UPI0015578517|nr:VOC family protein [Permianibacter fluminis]NQD38913.1 VOC family protein [Permianibacter fluminis]
MPELMVNDYDRAKQFYRDVLGFALCFERTEDRFGYFDRGGAQIMLLERPHGSAALPPVTDSRLHFQIEVDQLEPLLDRLAGAGHCLHKPPYTARYRGNDCVYVQREFFVRDLDGYLLRFFQHQAEEPLV